MELDDLQGHLQSNLSYDSVTLWFYGFAFLLGQLLVFAVERFLEQRPMWDWEAGESVRTVYLHKLYYMDARRLHL